MDFIISYNGIENDLRFQENLGNAIRYANPGKLSEEIIKPNFKRGIIFKVKKMIKYIFDASRNIFLV